MKIILAIPGSFKSDEMQELTLEYVKRAGRYAKVSLELLPLAKSEKCPEDMALQRFLDHRSARAELVVLSEKGKCHKSSVDFARWLKTIFDRGATELIFAVGGAHEYGPDIMKNAKHLVSLSSLTLPHELALVVTAEQIYRALTIENGHPYHNE
jgi:23S rRNA (pseudouridine1915-N3)-methyltransferase